MHDRPDAGGASAATASPAQPAGTRVSIRNVRRQFQSGVLALDDITLDVPPGQFIAILGPSGSGKSTLLRLIAGLDAPQGGDIAINHETAAPVPPLPPGEASGIGDRPRAGRGEGVSGSGLAPLAYRTPAIPPRSRLAYVFQDAHLLPWRSVLRNVALPLELQNVPKAQSLARAREAIDQVGLSEAADRYPAQLSGGMRMRASLARALVTDPSLFLLDEPFAALDEITRHRLDEQLLALWRRRRMTVIFVTHSINEAVFLAERAVVLSRRPARILLDRRIELPEERTEELRTTAAFAAEAHALHMALRGEEA